MPRTLFVTQGEYAGRYMRLEDDVAKKALSDGWARESETEPEEPNPAKLKERPKPTESLKKFDEGEVESDVESDDDEEKSGRKYTRRKS